MALFSDLSKRKCIILLCPMYCSLNLNDSRIQTNHTIIIFCSLLIFCNFFVKLNLNNHLVINTIFVFNKKEELSMSLEWLSTLSWCENW